MEEYQDLVLAALNGTYKKNRTDADTIATFSEQCKFDLSSSYPLLTTKKMDTFRWESMVHELIWYISGEHHIKNLRQKTQIWDTWADQDWNLPSSYGRLWRRYPVPQPDAQLPGEAWADDSCPWVSTDNETGTPVFDQLKYVVDTLQGENPNRGPKSRRLVVSAWHPANADVSELPPCHYTFVLNVQNSQLNAHLTQRSADIALGVPFNIASYSLLLKVISEVTDFEPGTFAHTLVDAHVYCGKGARGEWYSNNLDELQDRIFEAEQPHEYRNLRKWIMKHAPQENPSTNPENHEYGFDHVPGLLEQVARNPRTPPQLETDVDSIEELGYDDIELRNYSSHDGIKFKVAE